MLFIIVIYEKNFFIYIILLLSLLILSYLMPFISLSFRFYLGFISVLFRFF